MYRNVFSFYSCQKIGCILAPASPVLPALLSCAKLGRLWQLCSRGRKFLSTKKAGLSTLYYLDIDYYPHLKVTLTKKCLLYFGFSPRDICIFNSIVKMIQNILAFTQSFEVSLLFYVHT